MAEQGKKLKNWGFRVDPKMLEKAKACMGRLSLNAFLNEALDEKIKRCKKHTSS